MPISTPTQQDWVHSGPDSLDLPSQRQTFACPQSCHAYPATALLWLISASNEQSMVCVLPSIQPCAQFQWFHHALKLCTSLNTQAAFTPVVAHWMRRLPTAASVMHDHLAAHLLTTALLLTSATASDTIELFHFSCLMLSCRSLCKSSLCRSQHSLFHSTHAIC